MQVNRGDIFWADLNPTVGAKINKLRPVVIISVNPLNQVRKTVIVIPLSTSAKEIKIINIALSSGVIARCDQIRTIDKSRLKNKQGEIKEKDLNNILESLKRIVGI